MDNLKEEKKEKEVREVDVLARSVDSWWGKTFVFIKKTRIKTWKGIFAVAFISGAMAATLIIINFNIQARSQAALGASLTLYTDDINTTLESGSDIVNVDILLDSHYNDIVAVKAAVTYDPQDFELQSWDTTNSVFSSNNSCIFNSQPCQIIDNNKTSGKITITVAKPTPGINTSSGIVAQLAFKALKTTIPATPNIRLDYTNGYADSDVIKNDGIGTDILTSVQGAKVNVYTATCNSFNYSNWSPCQPDGTESRTVTDSLPSGCFGGNPTLEQVCDYPTTTACTSINYSDWSLCQPDGTQSRTVVSKTPADCTEEDAILTQNCLYTVPTCTEIVYSDWGACQPGGNQTRTVVSRTPGGCATGDLILEQECIFSMPACTSFEYFEWGECQFDGTQSRTITAGLPAGCTGGNPELSQSCNYTIPTCTSFTYSDWSVCQPGGTMTREILEQSPEGCTGGNPQLSRTCELPPSEVACTSFEYSNWGACQVNGTQIRMVIGSSPSGCTGSEPVLSKFCSYSTPICISFKYSDWGVCQVGGKQFREITSRLPVGCDGGEPITEKSCKVPPSVCTNFTYSEWNVCQPNGTQSRVTKSSSPAGCKGGEPELTRACTYKHKSQPKAAEEPKEHKDREKPHFTDMSLFLNKNRGDIIWWKATDNKKIDHYTYNFNGKKVKTDKDHFLIPANTKGGIYVLRIKAYDKEGNSKSRLITIRVK
jgi:hypothetical protein